MPGSEKAHRKPQALSPDVTVLRGTSCVLAACACVCARLYVSVYSGEYGLGQQRGKGSDREVEESSGSGPLPHRAQAHTRAHTHVRE